MEDATKIQREISSKETTLPKLVEAMKINENARINHAKDDIAIHG